MVGVRATNRCEENCVRKLHTSVTVHLSVKTRYVCYRTPNIAHSMYLTGTLYQWLPDLNKGVFRQWANVCCTESKPTIREWSDRLFLDTREGTMGSSEARQQAPAYLHVLKNTMINRPGWVETGTQWCLEWCQQLRHVFTLCFYLWEFLACF